MSSSLHKYIKYSNITLIGYIFFFARCNPSEAAVSKARYMYTREHVKKMLPIYIQVEKRKNIFFLFMNKICLATAYNNDLFVLNIIGLRH